MTTTDTLDLLAMIFAAQDEDGDVFDITPERVAAIAAGDWPSDEEAGILLASPLAREALALQLRLHDLRVSERRRGAANDDDFELHSILEAAATGDLQELELACPAGRLQVEKGPSGDAPFLLTLELNPEHWSSGVASRRIAVVEPRPDGLEWMRGWTDHHGALRTIWRHGTGEGMTPRARLAASGALLITEG